jgi:DNA-binding transcriptional LysR family regulator
VDLDLRLVRYFVAVGEELHFGRAAAKLFISQPALSKQIRRLEAQLGEPLLARDSRSVVLTPRGERLLVDGRQLLSLAERVRYPPEPDVVRMAHVYELGTSRAVADAFGTANPDVTLVEQQLDSYRQLEALLAGRLDVAILRVTAQMRIERPTGWQHRLLRLEPMLLIGRPGDGERETASLSERPVEVFGDGPESHLFNAHGEYLRAFELRTGIALRWLGNPGTLNHCLAAVRRARRPAFVLEFGSYAARYAEAGLPVHRPVELQPYYPWSIAWRDEPPSAALAELLRIAEQTAVDRGWRTAVPQDDVPVWIPTQ